MTSDGPLNISLRNGTTISTECWIQVLSMRNTSGQKKVKVLSSGSQGDSGSGRIRVIAVESKLIFSLDTKLFASLSSFCWFACQSLLHCKNQCSKDSRQSFKGCYFRSTESRDKLCLCVIYLFFINVWSCLVVA